MDGKWIGRIIGAMAAAVAIAVVLQELEKPEEERKWHGKVAGFIPYDFRIPTAEKLKEAYWNAYERRVFIPAVFGIGWAINFYTLLENLGVIGTGVSEENFLMPTKSIREALENLPAEE